MRGIFRTLEKNTYLTEKRKQDWIDKALEMGDKHRQKAYEEALDHQKRLEEIKKKEFYRDAVKKRNNDILEERKQKTLWRLEKLELKNSPNRLSDKYRSADGREIHSLRASY